MKEKVIKTSKNITIIDSFKREYNYIYIPFLQKPNL